MKQIAEFVGKYRFLSNFYQTSFEYRGLVYLNAEAAFQAQKCENEADKVKYTETKNPALAKHMGRREHLPEDWDEKSVDIMRDSEIKIFRPRACRNADRHRRCLP